MSSGKIDIKEDEEQQIKFQQIVDLLLAAGYFRARIKGLSAFDKVVGGIVWCIEMSNFDVDVDFLFQEDSSIGTKIALTEKIVAVVRKMKCPHFVEPHQIQGLDFIHIFPMVQWLVKKAIETKEEMGDYIRSYSVSQFKKSYGSTEDLETDQIRKSIDHLHEAYLPKRAFKPKYKLKSPDEQTRVELTLLEYGHGRGRQYDVSEEQVSEEEEKVQALMRGLTTSDDQSKLSAQALSGLMKSEELTKAAEQYKELQEKLEREKAEKSPLGLAQAIQMLENQKADMKARIETVTSQGIEATERLRVTKEAMKELKAEMESLVAEEMELGETTDEDDEVLRKMQAMVTRNEELKKAEAEFRKECKEKAEKLSERNKALEREVAGSVEKEVKEGDLAEARGRLKAVRKDLAGKTRSLASVQRQLDDIPSKYELAQYQKRFVELYHQVEDKHSETQQFCTMHNSLQDQKAYMNKEVSMLNSILENFSSAAVSGQKQRFLNQLEQLAQGVQQAKGQAEMGRRDEEKKREMANKELNQLVDEHRKYTILLRDMREEMKKNDVIQRKLEV